MMITILGERPKSWNTFYSGKHWAVRAKESRRVHAAVKKEIYAMMDDPQPIEGRVRIAVRGYFKNRPLDPCNITAKLYIDGLLELLIVDDSPEYVAGVLLESHVDKENPRVTIEIVPEFRGWQL